MNRPPRDEPANALVVDWDFFFPNLFMSLPEGREQEWLLYDWTSGEDDFGRECLAGFAETVWGMRGSSFYSRGFELPRCTGWERFWDRFTGLEDAFMLVADSNLYSGPEHFLPEDGGPWDRIDLYDAHHDSGYRHGENHVHCGNWMAAHRARGTAGLHVHYPSWRSVDCTGEKPPVIEVERTVDDGAPVPIRYQAVFLCRSGSWVPPWCDQDFELFVEAYPGPWEVHKAADPVEPRPFDDMGARVQAVMTRVASGGEDALVRLQHLARQAGETGVIPDVGGDTAMADALGLLVLGRMPQADGQRLPG